MKVIRLTDSSFHEACGRLAHKINKFQPDVVIGIESGGAHVLREMINAEFQNKEVIHDTILIQRNSTGGLKKKTFVKTIVKLFPSWIIRILRRFEMSYSEFKAKIQLPERVVEINLTDHILKQIKGGCKILIVDDAVDTGTTLRLAIDHIKSLNSESKIKTAVLTITHKNPVVTPDFFLYKRTILQFPWSLDSK